MDTIPELIDAFGGPTAFSRIVGKRPSTASEMKRNRSIPVEYWPSVIEAAGKLGIKGVTAEMLMLIHRSPPAGRRPARGRAGASGKTRAA